MWYKDFENIIIIKEHNINMMKYINVKSITLYTNKCILDMTK